MEDASFRVSDAEREQVVLSLRDHLMAGRLTPEEFSERVEAALKARVSGELAHVQEDLPGVSPQAVRPHRKATRFTTALFGHVARRARLRLRRWTFAVSACGDLDFDLREATIDLPQTAVTALVAFGNVDVYVPEGVTSTSAGSPSLVIAASGGATSIGRTPRPCRFTRSAAGRSMYGGCRTTCEAATATSFASSGNASASFRRETDTARPLGVRTRLRRPSWPGEFRC